MWKCYGEYAFDIEWCTITRTGRCSLIIAPLAIMRGRNIIILTLNLGYQRHRYSTKSRSFDSAMETHDRPSDTQDWGHAFWATIWSFDRQLSHKLHSVYHLRWFICSWNCAGYQLIRVSKLPWPMYSHQCRLINIWCNQTNQSINPVSMLRKLE